MIFESQNLLGGLTHQQFLDEYWQQKPLLVRQAFPDITPPFSAEELAGLCCDTEAPGRIVIEKGKTPWQVIHAPLQEEHFLELPDTHWTLLVNDLERYYPEHLKLFENFHFIPDWRRDDLMVSFAPEGGSVGPHIDDYDVFLIQAVGKRHWMLDSTVDSTKIVPDIALRLLSDFNTQQDWVLEPGDMLYLPPNLAHYGVAVNDCMTYSVGFRAPSQQELLESWLATLAKNERTLSRYRDAKRPLPDHFSEIENVDIQAIKAHFLQAVEENDDLFTSWIGSHLTQVKNSDQEDFSLEEIAPEDGISYCRASSTRLAWIKQDDGIMLFANGEASNWPDETKELICYLCENYHYKEASLMTFKAHSDNHKLLAHLVEVDVIEKLI